MAAGKGICMPTEAAADQKGILLIAGGGGGATSAGNGGAGGSQEGLLETGYDGESGGAGGGGGFRGGAAGERIVHHHTDSCYRDSSYDGLAGAVLAHEGDSHIDVGHNWEEGECGSCYQYSGKRAGSRANLIPVRGNTSVEIQAVLWKQICRGGELWEESCLRVYDQNGRCFFSRDLSNIIHNSKVVRSQIIERQDRAWLQNGANVLFPRFNTEFIWYLPRRDDNEDNNGGYEKYWSVRNSDGTSEVMGEIKNDGESPARTLWGKTNRNEWDYELFPDFKFHETGDTGCHLDNTPLFFVRSNGCYESGVLLDYTIDIPDKTTGIYVETCAWGDAAVSHDLVFSLITEVMLKGGKEVICGMSEGQIIDSRPSYGGSSYVNEEYAYSCTKQAGVQKGDGSFCLKSVTVGFLDELSLEGVRAPDLAAPDAVDGKTVEKEGLAAGKVLVTWKKPEDRGTDYYHVAESYFAGSGAALCRSNETVNTLTSGVKGYYYCVNENENTRVTNTAHYTKEPSVTVQVGEKVCYLHLAAVDVAGNMSDTLHIPLDADGAARPLHTEYLSIEEAENVYPAGGRSWYVRSDGTTPFTLGYKGYVDGLATEKYQINHAVFVSAEQGDRTSCESRIFMQNQPVSPGNIRIPDRFLNFTEEAEGNLTYYPYTQAWREEGNSRVSVTQKFILDSQASGKRTEVYPRAGADWNGEVFYSAREEDRHNGLILIGDGAPPVIRGMELLENLDLIDRRVNAPILSLTAADELSGVRDFWLMVYNGDNNCSRKFVPDGAGQIQVELTVDDPLFSGDFTAVAHAVDHVGNETSVSGETTEFGLSARIERILPPHDPVFQNGESGILSIAVWGYPDYVEIEFPAEMTGQNPELNRRIEYAGNPRYCQEEQLQFMIPLYTPANADYTITVRAYKGNRKLEQYPELSVVEVNGTVLDDFRTRLR